MTSYRLLAYGEEKLSLKKMLVLNSNTINTSACILQVNTKQLDKLQTYIACVHCVFMWTLSHCIRSTIFSISAQGIEGNVQLTPYLPENTTTRRGLIIIPHCFLLQTHL